MRQDEPSLLNEVFVETLSAGFHYFARLELCLRFAEGLALPVSVASLSSDWPFPQRAFAAFLCKRLSLFRSKLIHSSLAALRATGLAAFPPHLTHHVRDRFCFHIIMLEAVLEQRFHSSDSSST